MRTDKEINSLLSDVQVGIKTNKNVCDCGNPLCEKTLLGLALANQLTMIEQTLLWMLGKPSRINDAIVETIASLATKESM